MAMSAPSPAIRTATATPPTAARQAGSFSVEDGQRRERSAIRVATDVGDREAYEHWLVRVSEAGWNQRGRSLARCGDGRTLVRPVDSQQQRAARAQPARRQGVPALPAQHRRLAQTRRCPSARPRSPLSRLSLRPGQSEQGPSRALGRPSPPKRRGTNRLHARGSCVTTAAHEPLYAEKHMAFILALLEGSAFFAAVTAMIFVWTRPIVTDWIDI